LLILAGGLPGPWQTGVAGVLTAAPSPALSQPRPGARWTNSLGMQFAPVPGTPVLFGIWETRVQDFEAFVRATHHDTGNAMFVANTNDWQLTAGCTWRSPGFEQGPLHPVVGVNWADARAFCRWLTRRERKAGLLTPRQGYRLPTDREWSCAVGLTNEPGATPKDRMLQVRDVFPWGNTWPPPDHAGNFEPSLGVEPFERTCPVGSFPANPFGLFDLAGNVAEWCEDWWSEPPKFRVLRGSPWNNDCRLCLMSSYRFLNLPDTRIDYYGFRAVLDPDLPPEPKPASRRGRAEG
jgi:formylglycine-generating enzyme required for sulfatase activity